MISRVFKIGTAMAIGFLVSSCSSGNESNSLMRMFSGNPERTITVAIKDGTAKQLKNSWDKKALSACGSTYTVVNLGSAKKVQREGIILSLELFLVNSLTG